MNFHPKSQEYNRTSARLKNHDYKYGTYFVTICTGNRECTLGKIVREKMRLNPYGTIVSEEWRRTAEIRSNVLLDEFVIMPNHLHGILIIKPFVGPIGEGQCDPIGEGQCDPIGEGQCDPIGGCQCDPIGGCQCDPIGEGQCDPIGEGQCDPTRACQRHAPTRRSFASPISHSLPTIIGQFKSIVTKRVSALSDGFEGKFWQRNYHEHVIRNDHELQNIRLYIRENPLNWEQDEEFIIEVENRR